jgi:UDP-glucose 4-epimerase
VKRVLVTGGSGFIGRHLCEELLEHGYEVIVFDRNPPPSRRYQIHQADIRDSCAVREAVSGCDGVFHLAGLVGTGYLETRTREAVEVNIQGTLNVFEAAREFDTYVINIGLVPAWANAYMITKKTAARFGEMFHGVFGTRITTIEFTHAYGPGQPTGPYRKAIPNFINRALLEEPLEVFGSGERLMDCVYAQDAAHALRLAAEEEAGIGRVIQVSSGKPFRFQNSQRQFNSSPEATRSFDTSRCVQVSRRRYERMKTSLRNGTQDRFSTGPPKSA